MAGSFCFYLAMEDAESWLHRLVTRRCSCLEVEVLLKELAVMQVQIVYMEKSF